MTEVEATLRSTGRPSTVDLADRGARPRGRPGSWSPTCPTTSPRPRRARPRGGTAGRLAARHGPDGRSPSGWRRAPGTRTYGARLGQGRLLRHAPGSWAGCRRRVFVPRAERRLRARPHRAARRRRRSPLTTVTYDRLLEVVRAGFAQRRKMLRRSLAGVVPAAAFAATASPPEARAEELNVVQWGRLAGWTEET